MDKIKEVDTLGSLDVHSYWIAVKVNELVKQVNHLTKIVEDIKNSQKPITPFNG